MNFENINIVIKDNIATITINRPKKLNTLNNSTIEELHNAFKNLDQASDVKVILITGSGKKAFVAGADISELANLNSEQAYELSRRGHAMLTNFIEKLNTPSIAMINGFALGGGLELAMSCHFRIASENAKMGLPETSLGLIPGYGGTQRLTKLIGKGKAMELIMTAEIISAKQALDCGLVNHVVKQEELHLLGHQIATKISKNSSIAISKAITAINASEAKNLDGYQIEIQKFSECFNTEDFKESTTAFINKTKNTF